MACPTSPRHSSSQTPSLESLNLTPNSPNSVTLSGDLTGEPNVVNQTIDFGGSIPAGTNVFTDANGHYSLTVTGASQGTITAQTMDGYSNVASAYFTPPTPSLTLSLIARFPPAIHRHALRAT